MLPLESTPSTLVGQVDDELVLALLERGVVDLDSALTEHLDGEHFGVPFEVQRKQKRVTAKYPSQRLRNSVLMSVQGESRRGCVGR